MNLTDIVPVEREVVLAMVNDPVAIDHAVQHLSADLFFRSEERRTSDLANLFVAMQDLRQSELPTTNATISNELKRRGQYSPEVATLIESAAYDACSTWSVPALCHDIAQAAEFRRLIALRDNLTRNIDLGVPASDLREWIVSQAENGRELSQADRPERLCDVMRRLADRTEDECEVAETGLATLDKILGGGFRAGQLIVVGARPSVGKSALAFQFTVSAAQAQNRVLYISIEMPNDELGARQVANGCKLQQSEVILGRMDEDDREQVRNLANRYEDVPLYLWEPTAPTLERIVATIRREVAAGTKMVVVDYVSLIRHTDKKKAHWERIGDITRAMKNAAKKHRIPIVLLAQVGRDAEKGDVPRRPTLADLKYSGDLEQDADAVLFLHRPNRLKSEAEIIVAKQRNGPLRAVDLEFDGPAFSFRESMGTEWNP